MRTPNLILIMAAVVVLGGGALVAKGLVGGSVTGGTFLTGSASSPSPTGPSAEELAAIERKKRETALTAALKEYAETVPEFSVAVLDRNTGETYAYRGDEQYETASIVKVQVLACLLLHAQADDRELTDSEDSRAKLMIRNSDNDATTSLFVALGKQSAIQKCDKKLGLTDTVVNSAWGLTKTTVSDQVKLLNQLVDEDSPLDEDSRDYAHTLMSTVSEDQEWGVPAAAKTGEEATVKNGWLQRSTENNLWIINSVGRITGDDVDVSIAVLSHQNATMPDGISVVEKAAKMTRTHLKY
ncbi:serine hydrolase [Actinoplanes sp. NPDC051851]|uniref:serine hydrolase n=1 Tax=Actinoplanes sp. NPDC051851 TaxID=3154753 RepID=UPI00342C1A3B